MNTYSVTVQYSYGTTLPQSITTMVIKRKTMNSGSAIAEVTSIFNALSNSTTELPNGDKLPYIQIISVSVQ